jgi:hypothetical protein
MPLHFGKIGAAIALLTVAAFVLWLLATTFFATEQADQKIEGTGAVELNSSAPRARLLPCASARTAPGDKAHRS